jgi:trigger factor
LKESRNIPSPIKREVRQRCGFGCVICGVPLYDYDHMIEFSEVKEHKADNLTLLCDFHHREKTNGLLSLEQVKKANKRPFNIENKSSTPYNFNFEGANFEFMMGGCELTIDNLKLERDFIIPILINNKKLISFEIIDKQLFFNLIVFDKKGELALKIVENEMIYNAEQWDIEFIGTRLKIREKHREILFDIEFNIPNGVKIHQGIFKYEGYEIQVKDGGFISKNIQLFCKRITNFRIIFALGKFNENIPVVVRSE